MEQPDDLAHLGRAARHYHEPWKRFVGGKSIHGVGRQLGPAMSNPLPAHDPRQAGNERGVHKLVSMSGKVPPLPLLWARRCTLIPDSTALVSTGSSMVSALMRRTVDRSASSRCFTPRSQSIPPATWNERVKASSGSVSASGMASFSSRNPAR